ncbi:MAG TPA: hypothetical protein VFO93_11105 [Hymenobacter sp.]|uniref:hypothetical protein n=1 Tax=Hymenobacter sp. TaxID=1898978 RepID=UPI002D80DA2E|nr:hypothetical protein [Hymenobacter sp.]HET9504082.1 hypothetical protein [Hymenobacter sp.]
MEPFFWVALPVLIIWGIREFKKSENRHKSYEALKQRLAREEVEKRQEKIILEQEEAMLKIEADAIGVDSMIYTFEKELKVIIVSINSLYYDEFGSIYNDDEIPDSVKQRHKAFDDSIRMLRRKISYLNGLNK